MHHATSAAPTLCILSCEIRGENWCFRQGRMFTSQLDGAVNKTPWPLWTHFTRENSADVPFSTEDKSQMFAGFSPPQKKGIEHIYIQNLPLSKKENNCYWELIKFWFRVLSADERRQREQSVLRLFTFHSWPDLWEQRRRLCAEQRRVCSQRRGEDRHPPRCFDKVWDTIKCQRHCVNASRSTPPLKSDFQQFAPADSCVRIPDPNCPDWLLMSTSACCIFRRRPVDKRFWSLWSLLPSMLIFQWVQEQ